MCRRLRPLVMVSGLSSPQIPWKGSIRRCRGPLVKSRCLHNCIDLASLPPPMERERLDPVRRGRVVHDKAPDRFIQARVLALLPFLRWLARGNHWRRRYERANSRETDFVRQIRSQAVVAGIPMPGYRDHPLVLEAMTSAATVVVVPAAGTNRSLTALEAIACGAPLIVSHRGGAYRKSRAMPRSTSIPMNRPRLRAAILALAKDPAPEDLRCLFAVGKEHAGSIRRSRLICLAA